MGGALLCRSCSLHWQMYNIGEGRKGRKKEISEKVQPQPGSLAYWTPECRDSFYKSCQLISSTSFLTISSASVELLIQTDASTSSLGTCLMVIGEGVDLTAASSMEEMMHEGWCRFKIPQVRQTFSAGMAWTQNGGKCRSWPPTWTHILFFIMYLHLYASVVLLGHSSCLQYPTPPAYQYIINRNLSFY